MAFPIASGTRAPALIFDVDGVIVHSTPVHNESWRHYLKLCGIEASLKEIEAAMLGRHNADIVRHFFGAGLPNEEVEKRGTDKEKIYRDFMTPRFAAQLVPGVVDFVRARAGGPLAVASNAEPENVRFVFEMAGLNGLIPVVVTGADIKRPKPFPDIYLQAARMLGVDAADCVVFEDSPTGVEAARAAGARVIGVTTSYARLDGVEFCVRDFLDPRIPRWLAGEDGAG